MKQNEGVNLSSRNEALKAISDGYETISLPDEQIAQMVKFAVLRVFHFDQTPTIETAENFSTFDFVGFFGANHAEWRQRLFQSMA
jgi:hypothetical protein